MLLIEEDPVTQIKSSKLDNSNDFTLWKQPVCLQSQIILNSQRIQILHRILLHNQRFEINKSTDTESTRYVIANALVNREFCDIRRKIIPVVAVADRNFESRN